MRSHRLRRVLNLYGNIKQGGEALAHEKLAQLAAHKDRDRRALLRRGCSGRGIGRPGPSLLPRVRGERYFRCIGGDGAAGGLTGRDHWWRSEREFRLRY